MEAGDNRGEGRDVLAPMTALEAVLAIEAFDIASASMLFYSRRGNAQSRMLKDMARRMGAAAGLSASLVSRIADRKSPIFVIARELSEGSVERVCVTQDEDGTKILVTLDASEFVLCDLPYDEKAMEKASRKEQSLPWYEHRALTRRIRDEGFEPFARELIDLLQRIAPVGVEFAMEQVVSTRLSKDVLVDREDRDAIEAVVLDAVSAITTLDAETMGWLRELDADPYSKGRTIDVTIRMIVPWEWRDDLGAALEGHLSTRRPKPGPTSPTP